MFEAVQHGAPEYTLLQRGAWMSEPRTGADWYERLIHQTVFVAEEANTILGFMGLDDDYIDLAFVHPQARRRGIFRQLYHEIELVAFGNDLNRIWTHSSLTAQAAFSAFGFTVIHRETVIVRNVELDRFELEKDLASVRQTTRDEQ